MLDVAAPRTQSDAAYRAVRSAILECRLAPGSVIDEKALMAELGFGRTPLREALLRLAMESLVIFRPGLGIQVSPVGLDQIRDLFELRLHLERLAARLMMARLTQARLEEVRHCFDPARALLRQGRIEPAIALDFRFHSLIYHASGNEFLIRHLHSLFGHSYRLWYLTHRDDVTEMSDIIRSHDPLVEAIVDGDSQRLDRELSSHIRGSFERVMTRFRGSSIDAISDMDVVTMRTKSRRKHHATHA